MVIELDFILFRIKSFKKTQYHSRQFFQMDKGSKNFNGTLNGFVTIKFAKYTQKGSTHGKLNQGLTTGKCFVLIDNKIRLIRGIFSDNSLKVKSSLLTHFNEVNN